MAIDVSLPPSMTFLNAAENLLPHYKNLMTMDVSLPLNMTFLNAVENLLPHYPRVCAARCKPVSRAAGGLSFHLRAACHSERT